MRRHRRHAGGGGHARLGAFERGEPRLEHRDRRVGEARVDVARLFVGELARRFRRALVDEARGERERFGVLLEVAAHAAGSDTEGVGLVVGCHGNDRVQSTRERPRSSW